MCGIAGVVSKAERAVQLQRLQGATDCLAHRGPHNNAVWVNESKTVGLAHQRLSIIDLSAAANQPLHYGDRLVIVYNGEIYNYLEIKQNLQTKGFSFNTASDTEVIAAAYIAYGVDCLQHFDGAFAFAIWDEKENKMFAARDRFGEKPFYFFYNEQELLFASEMKALWKAGVPKEVNPALLYNFLTIGYTANPGNPQETFYSNIQKLPTASYLTYSLHTQELVVQTYWQVEVKENKNMGDAAAIEELRHLLTESVQKRLRSDVAVGTSLSGGLDSSAIAALCAQQHTPTYTHKSFTAIFPQFEKNEQSYAARVAQQFRLQHTTVAVTEEDLLRDMEKMMYHQEEPINSASALAQYKVFQAARQQGVTVLLDGQGADEILGGYSKYYKWYWQQLYRQKGLKKSGELQAAQSMGVQETFTLPNKMAALLPEFAAAMLQSRKAKWAARHPHLNPDFASAQKRSLYYTLPTHPDLNGALFFNTFQYGLEELLRTADRNSMAHSVEVRLPFLSHRLVAFLFTLPPHFKIRQGWTKWLLRQTMADMLPADIVWRKDKVGFEPPQQQWMQSAAVKERIEKGKKILVENGILSRAALRTYTPTTAIAANPYDWRYWSASFLFTR